MRQSAVIYLRHLFPVSFGSISRYGYSALVEPDNRSLLPLVYSRFLIAAAMAVRRLLFLPLKLHISCSRAHPTAARSLTPRRAMTRCVTGRRVDSTMVTRRGGGSAGRRNDPYRRSSSSAAASRRRTSTAGRTVGRSDSSAAHLASGLDAMGGRRGRCCIVGDRRWR
jgi:hypothetical protein